MAVCKNCNEELPQAEKGFIYFHVCKGSRVTEDQKAENLAQAMLELTTEYDWEEIPSYIQHILRNSARELIKFKENSSIQGEVVEEQRELLPWVQEEYDRIIKGHNEST